MFRRRLAVLLSIAMIFTMLPVQTGFAAELPIANDAEYVAAQNDSETGKLDEKSSDSAETFAVSSGTDRPEEMIAEEGLEETPEENFVVEETPNEGFVVEESDSEIVLSEDVIQEDVISEEVISEEGIPAEVSEEDLASDGNIPAEVELASGNEADLLGADPYIRIGRYTNIYPVALPLNTPVEFDIEGNIVTVTRAVGQCTVQLPPTLTVFEDGIYFYSRDKLIIDAGTNENPCEIISRNNGRAIFSRGDIYIRNNLLLIRKHGCGFGIKQSLVQLCRNNCRFVFDCSRNIPETHLQGS